MSDSKSVLHRLMDTIVERQANPSEKSYTCKLLAGGVSKIAAKISEEAAEVIEAAGESGADGQKHLVHEAGDLIYHLWVMLAHRGASVADVEAELARRFAMSGLEEKASRSTRTD